MVVMMLVRVVVGDKLINSLDSQRTSAQVWLSVRRLMVVMMLVRVVVGGKLINSLDSQRTSAQVWRVGEKVDGSDDVGEGCCRR